AIGSAYSAPRKRPSILRRPNSEVMNRHSDPLLLSDVAVILIDCGRRPEECFRLRPGNVAGDVLEIHFGKTDNARRRIPLTARGAAVLKRRNRGGEGVFAAPTRSGHIEPSSLKKQHANAVKKATEILRKETGLDTVKFEAFEFYTLR